MFDRTHIPDREMMETALFNAASYDCLVEYALAYLATLPDDVIKEEYTLTFPARGYADV